MSALHVPGVPLPLPSFLTDGVAAGVRGAADLAGQVTGRLAGPLLGLERRGVWERPGRRYIEVRGVHGPEGARLARLVERALEEHPGVLWARVNAPSERAVVALGSPAAPTRELVALIEWAERRSAVPETYEHDEWLAEPHHPGEGPRTRQSVSALAADAIGLATSTASRLLPWAPLPSEVAGLVGALQTHPRLRRLAQRGLPGQDSAESVLPVVSALVQGVATRGGGLVLDVAQRVSQWREAAAERDAWAAAEPGLVPGPEEAAAGPVAVERPVPHRDTAARFAERAMGAGALAGAAATPFAGPRRGLAVALAAVPKAPGAGREGFATTLGRFLSLRGVVVMDRGALRRLGQVDTVVLEEQALRTDRYEPVDLALLSGADPGRTAERLFALLDPEAALETRRDDDGWVLGPLEGLTLTGRTGRQAAARLRKRGSERFLGLARGRRLEAVAGLATQTAPGAEAVAAAARRAGARVVLATDRREPAFGFADAVVPGGDRLAGSVRELQAAGSVVLLVSGNRRALGAADCGVGVHHAGDPPAWGAHLLVGADLEAAGLVVDAVGVAARVDHDSAVLATGGSGVGAVAALQSPPPRAAARGAAAGTAAGSAAFGMGVWRARQLLSRPVDPPVSTTPWHLMPVDRVLERLDTTPEGLAPDEAASRVGASPGSAEPARTTLPAAFVEELANPLTPVLAAGAALAAAVGSRTDAALVGAITGTSALVGSVQRVRTERALAGLFARSAIGARVRRGGAERLVTAGDLVHGDIVVLRPEDVVPADCRLLEAEGVEVDESSLTGESLPVAKDPAPVVAAQLADRRSMLYEGTMVSAGRAVAVVVATGASTEVGRSMATARRSAPATGVEARLTRLTRAGLPLALGSAAAVAGAGLLHGHRITETLASAVNLAVASVPEGLPLLVNAAQLAAARRLAEDGALVRNPRTIEALGRADVLCFDKTGTLTEGHLELAAVSDGETAQPVDRLGPEHRAVLAAALRATPPARQSEPMAHQTDRAVAAGARRAKVAVRRGAASWRRTYALAFDPSRAYHATAGRTSRGGLLSVKGAPENVLPRCRRRRLDGETTELDEAARHDLTATAEKLAGAGRRVLAVAERTLATDARLTDETVEELVFLGFVTLADPVRSGAAPATARLREAGVQIVMLTGDHPATAGAIASTVSEDAEPVVSTGPELDELDDAELDALLPRVDVIARCSPRHKVRIVQAYQRLGRVVAMTGDGANDAPAIRLADVGIALGRRGTPAATAAADLVVGDDRLETIISALLEGRSMWASVRAALAILIGGNLGEVSFSVLASALTGAAPLNARQIMLVNLLTDLAPALAIAVREPNAEAGERLLREGPHQSLGAALTYEMLVRGATTAAGAGLAWGLARLTGRQRRASTVALAAVVGTQLAQTLLAGGLNREVLVAGLGSAAVLAAIIQTPVVSPFFGCTPLGPVGWGMAFGGIASATLLGAVLSPLARRLAAEDGEDDVEYGEDGEDGQDVAGAAGEAGEARGRSPAGDRAPDAGPEAATKSGPETGPDGAAPRATGRGTVPGTAPGGEP
ncbi:cation-translocating P-type ATPase [Streptomyces sp. JJ36]|uniref:cation-translocating P-type ATPase n=1 Tax=Streptomyces sp. JJ36 TaxID=2736645 RepID=UPI002351B11F|nr:cation-translocating P-type ATPase [Streptomyces sp. JJ36]MCF6522905.1 cation-translocating P-type ATPase [Streptomyces sp. JJ36]